MSPTSPPGRVPSPEFYCSLSRVSTPFLHCRAGVWVPAWGGASRPRAAPRGAPGAHLLLLHLEQDVLPGPHSRHLSADADPQAAGRGQGARQLLRAPLQVHAPLTGVGHRLPVPAGGDGSGPPWQVGGGGDGPQPGRGLPVAQRWLSATPPLTGSSQLPPMAPSALLHRRENGGSGWTARNGGTCFRPGTFPWSDRITGDAAAAATSSCRACR